MENYINIFIPTDKNNLKILDLLKNDKLLKINLCVKSELDDNKIFDNLKNNSQINIIRLGYNLKTLGEMKQNIINYCNKNNYEFCPLFNDNIISLYSYDNEKIKCSELIKNSINLIKNDELNKYIAGFTFINQNKEKTIKSYLYLSILPKGAYILNIKNIIKNNISFKSSNIYGFEEMNFFIDCLKNGLIFIDRVNYNFKDIYNIKETNKILKLTTTQTILSLNYISNIFGITVGYKYSKRLNEQHMYITPDLNYFRDVLVYNREKNKNIILNNFNIMKCIDDVYIKD